MVLQSVSSTKGRRPRIEDFYQNYNFHVFDLSLSSDVSIDSALTTLSPTMGFASVDVPTLTLEHEEIDPMNRPHKYKVVKSGTVDSFTLSRGVKVGDTELYEWAKRAQYGRGGSVRKRLLIVQLHTQFFTDNIISKLGQFARGVSMNFTGQVASRLSELGFGQSLSGGIGALTVGAAVDTATRFTGDHYWANRMWVLEGCIPEEYSPNDTLDASDSEVSIMSLTVAPEQIEEYSFAPSF